MLIKILKIQPTNIRRSQKEYNCNCDKCIQIKIKEAKDSGVRYRIPSPVISKKEQNKRKAKQLSKYKKEAYAKGLLFIGNSKTKPKHFRRYRFVECGHETDIQLSVVRHANPYCHECKEEEFKADALKVGLRVNRHINKA